MQPRLVLSPTRRALTAAAVTTVLVCVLAIGHTTRETTSTETTQPVAAVRFSLSGKAVGLFPGADRPLRIRVRNPYSFAIKVRNIRVRVEADPRRPACVPASYVRLLRSQSPLVVPRRSERRTQLSITLSADAPDSCRGADFPLRLSGTAWRA